MLASVGLAEVYGPVRRDRSPVVLPVTLMSPRLVATADSERLSPAVGATRYRRSESAVHVRCQPYLPGSYLREVGTILPTCVG